MQAGTLQSLLLKKPKNLVNFQKLIKHAGWNKSMQDGFFSKLISCAARLFDRLE